MKNKILLSAIFGLTVLLPAASSADDTKDTSSTNITGEVGLGGVYTDGRKDSAKAEEYRDLSNGPSGDLKLKYDDKATGDYATLNSENIDREDQKTVISGGRYGQYKYEFSYNQTPHRFAYGAETIYSGVGHGNLTLPDSVKTDLSGAKSQADLVNRLNNLMTTEGRDVNLEILRKTGKLKMEYDGYKPYTFRLDISSEDRDGKRPGMGSFGFGNVVELVEPVNYNTSQARLSGDYTTKGFYFAANYYLSVFQNDTNTLSYDNPFKLTDSTSPSAYTNPTFVNGAYVNNGAARGVVALAPDNLYHGASVTTAISDLPWKTHVNLAGSWGWMLQDDNLLPYTSNTAIKGIDGTRTFDASNAANLPVESPNASVSTSLYSLGATSHPISWLDASAKYRYYNYNNNMDQITFPGFALVDSTWQSESVTTQPTSYNKQNAGVDLGVKLQKNTRLGLLYNYASTHRENREVANQSENTIGTSIDHRLNDLLNLKASYEKSYRHAGNYDFTKPFGGEDMPGQLPLLRKYYEASRDMDSVHFLSTVTPNEKLDVTGGFLYANSNFDKSVFGLLDDRSYQLSADADYAGTSWMTLKPSYSYEHHNGSQAARQWNPGTLGDPYVVDTGISSNSNWNADTEDIIHTIGAGATFTFIPKKLFFDLNYAYVIAKGNVNFKSPVGTALNDANAFDPGSFDQVDNSTAHRVNPSLRYKITKAVTVSLGYLWERYTFHDFEGIGYSAVPTTATGAYNGALLGSSYPFKDYNINMIYANCKYRF
jgi:MtrB/PioB family decaheme-associated outer membrane protein